MLRSSNGATRALLRQLNGGAEEMDLKGLGLLPVNGAELARALPGNATLASLHLRDNPLLGADALVAICGALRETRVVHLDLGLMDAMPDAHLLARALAATGYPWKPRRANLAAALAPLLGGAASLRTLDLSDSTDYGDVGVAAIVRALCLEESRVKTLKLNRMGLGNSRLLCACLHC